MVSYATHFTYIINNSPNSSKVWIQTSLFYRRSDRSSGSLINWFKVISHVNVISQVTLIPKPTFLYCIMWLYIFFISTLKHILNKLWWERSLLCLCSYSPFLFLFHHSWSFKWTLWHFPQPKEIPFHVFEEEIYWWEILFSSLTNGFLSPSSLKDIFTRSIILGW